MTLSEALRVLAEVHTRTDQRGAGFVVIMGAGHLWFEPDLTVEAWKTVRQYLELPVEHDPNI